MLSHRKYMTYADFILNVVFMAFLLYTALFIQSLDVHRCLDPF